MAEPTPEELQDQIDALLLEKAAWIEEKEELQNEVNSLKEQLALQKHEKLVSRKTFEYEGKTYNIMAKKCIIDGQEYSDEQIAASAELQETLVEFLSEGRTEEDFNKNGLLHIIFT